MGRAFPVARPAGLLAARCAPAAPSTLGTLRLRHQSGLRTAARPTPFDAGEPGGDQTGVRDNRTASHNLNREKPTTFAGHRRGGRPGAAASNNLDREKPTFRRLNLPGTEARYNRTATQHPGREQHTSSPSQRRINRLETARNDDTADPEKPTDKHYMRSEKTPAGYVEWNKEQLKLHIWNGEWSEGLAISNLWLRDSCPCHQCVDPDSGQKNFSTTDLHDRPKVSYAKLQPDGSLKVIWASDRPSGGLSHTSIFSADEVAAWQAEDKWQRGRVAVHNAEKIYWDRAGYEALLADGRCRVSYKDWMNNEAAFWDAFADLRQTGLIFVTDVPSNEEEVERIATRIGPLQDTFYGRTWDVKSKPQAENVAYTSKFLGLHQDLMYHDPVPGLQLLHCISNTCEGGESLFSNGVRAAYELKLHQTQNYHNLTKLKSWFGYRKGDNHYFMSRHTIATDPQGNPTETRWAPPFQATFQITSSDKRAANLALWKKAATAFQSVVEAESNMVQIKLKAGECVIFDNRRILHGRRQFTTGTGSRWLKGAYVTQQNYSAAATRLWEYLRELGMALPPQRLHWKEEQNVEASLEARRLASARFPSIKKFMQSEGLARPTAEVEDAVRTTDSVVGDVEIPELIPRPWAAHYTEPVQESEVAQNAEPAENAESAENAEPVEKAQPSEIVEPAENVEPAPNAEPAPPKE